MTFEWIDINIELPEDGQLCAVFDPTNTGERVWSATWSKEHKVFFANGGWFNLDEISHWMKLPKPPGML